MTLIVKKLKSRSGVSALIAMMLFLVVSMVSITIISASLTAVRRIDDDKTHSQAYLAAGSAAKLLEQCLRDSACTVIETTETTSDPEAGTSVIDETTEVTSEGPLADALQAAVEEAVSSEVTGAGTPVTITVVPDDPEVAKKIPSAELTFTMNAEGEYEDYTDSYKINGVITVENSDQKVFFTAWIPTLSPTTTTENMENRSVRITTTRLQWSGVKLFTMGGADEWIEG